MHGGDEGGPPDVTRRTRIELAGSPLLHDALRVDGEDTSRSRQLLTLSGTRAG